jgi:acid phosphatase
VEPTCNGGTTTLIRSGTSAVLSWQATNATSVSVQQVPNQQFAVADSYTTPALSESTIYNVTASGPGGTTSAQATVTVTSEVPEHRHVALIVEENLSYNEVIGNPDMPYLNKLAENGAVATEYFANTHGSLRDYFELTAGQFLVSGGDFNGSVTADNIAAHVINAGKTWKSYAEALPYAGYTGYNVYPYEKDHNPFAYFTDIAGDPAQAANLVPFGQLSADLQQGNLPNLIYIAPDAQHDAHDCPTSASCTDEDKLAVADQWLKTNVEPLIESDAFKQSGLLLITFDESVDGDNENGGGHVVLVAYGPKVRSGYRSHKFYQHQNTLKSLCEALDLRHCPGDADNARSMLDLFVP